MKSRPFGKALEQPSHDRRVGILRRHHPVADVLVKPVRRVAPLVLWGRVVDRADQAHVDVGGELLARDAGHHDESAVDEEHLAAPQPAESGEAPHQRVKPEKNEQWVERRTRQVARTDEIVSQERREAARNRDSDDENETQQTDRRGAAGACPGRVCGLSHPEAGSIGVCNRSGDGGASPVRISSSHQGRPRGRWGERGDSNPRPSGPQPDALTT